MFKASPFKLTMYETCPQQFKFTYVDGLADEYKTPKPYLTMGAHVHNSLKDFYEQLPPAQRTYEALEQMLRKRWTENRQGFRSRDDEHAWGMKALQMLKLFFYKNDVTKNPLLLEGYYETELRDDVAVLGRIDRVDQDAAGLHVIDYKTGQFHPEEISPQQLLIYALIISAEQALPVYQASYLYLATNQWYSLAVTDAALAAVATDLLAQVDRIRADQEFTPRVGRHCRHCDYIAICPMAAAAKQFLQPATASL